MKERNLSAAGPLPSPPRRGEGVRKRFLSTGFRPDVCPPGLFRFPRLALSTLSGSLTWALSTLTQFRLPSVGVIKTNNSPAPSPRRGGLGRGPAADK
jgi:hypothetical protein